MAGMLWRKETLIGTLQKYCFSKQISLTIFQPLRDTYYVRIDRSSHILIFWKNDDLDVSAKAKMCRISKTSSFQ